MASSFSNSINTLAEEIHKFKFKYETCGIKYKDCEYCLEYAKVKDDLIECKRLCCNKN